MGNDSEAAPRLSELGLTETRTATSTRVTRYTASGPACVRMTKGWRMSSTIFDRLLSEFTRQHGHRPGEGVQSERRQQDVDSWTPAEEDNEEGIRVYVDGIRHDNESREDYPDAIRADNVCPRCEGAVQLRIPDARRLALALLAACDLAEGVKAG